MLISKSSHWHCITVPLPRGRSCFSYLQLQLPVGCGLMLYSNASSDVATCHGDIAHLALCGFWEDFLSAFGRESVNARPVALGESARPLPLYLSPVILSISHVFSTSHVFSKPGYLSHHVEHTCRTFLPCDLCIRNILSLSYDLCFEYRFHCCVLRDETNKTRSHLRIF